MEAMNKRKADAYDRLAGKRTKVAGRKKVVEAPNATASIPNAATVATPITTAASVLKFGATPKVAAAAQKGGPGTMKVATLKVKSRVKRPSDTELALAKSIKE
jgi:hypothetical protein